MRRIVWCFALLVACTSNNDWCDLTGHWQGTWTSGGGPSGAMATTFSQSAHDVAGTVSFASSPCYDVMDLALVQTGQQLSGPATAGAIEIDLTAGWVEDHIEGTYDAVAAGACTGDTGTFTLQRQ